MIDVINYSNRTFESSFTQTIDDAYKDVQKLLDNIPEVLQVKFTDNGGSDITGVGGFAFSHSQINLAVLEDFIDREAQIANLRSTVFHESFHIQQGFTYSDSPFTALDAAVYEGSAIAFERDYAQNDAAYGDYSAYTYEQLQGWLNEIKSVGTRYFEDEETWHKWAFYHPDYDQRWIVYKVGSWLVDRILLTNNLDILDLKDKTAQEIEALD
jgi:uncharacterized protein YjaZ